MCGLFIGNGDMACSLPSIMLGLRQDRHNSALQHLLSQPEQTNGGRLETNTADFGSKPIKTFTSDTFHELYPQPDTPSIHHNQMPTTRVNANECLDHSSLLTRCPGVLLVDNLPAQHRPQAHKPGFIRLLEPRLVGHTSPRRRYSSIRKIQTREWKYLTNNYLKDTHHLVIEKCIPSQMHFAQTSLAHMWTSSLESGVAHAHPVLSLTSTSLHP
jgi:hypothetical protein